MLYLVGDLRIAMLCNEGHISLFRLFIVHNMQSSPITRLQGTEMRHARSTHPKAQGRARVGQTKHTHAQARDSDVRPAAREARAAQQTATGAAVANRRHDRASARIQWMAIANISCNDNSTLSQRIRHSNVTATPIATTRNWYCRGQYTAGSGDRIPPQRDTLSCTKSRQFTFNTIL